MARIVKALKEAAAAADVDIQRLENELERLKAVKQGLDYAIERELKPKREPQHPGAANGWGGISRTVAVEKVLQEAPEPLSPVEIAQELARHGRNDPAGGVSASLSRLKNEERVVQVTFGKWKAPDTGEPPNARERLESSAAP